MMNEDVLQEIESLKQKVDKMDRKIERFAESVRVLHRIAMDNREALCYVLDKLGILRVKTLLTEEEEELIRGRTPFYRNREEMETIEKKYYLSPIGMRNRMTKEECKHIIKKRVDECKKGSITSKEAKILSGRDLHIVRKLMKEIYEENDGSYVLREDGVGRGHVFILQRK